MGKQGNNNWGKGGNKKGHSRGKTYRGGKHDRSRQDEDRQKTSGGGGGDGDDNVADSITEARSTGSCDLVELKASEEYARRYETLAPKRKYALCFGYLGTRYHGLQVNPDAFTVEQQVEKALFLAGGLQESNFGNLQKIQWTRAARTDKGVHANGQCCSMRLSVPITGLEQITTYTNGQAEVVAAGSVADPVGYVAGSGSVAGLIDTTTTAHAAVASAAASTVNRIFLGV